MSRDRVQPSTAGGYNADDSNAQYIPKTPEKYIRREPSVSSLKKSSKNRSSIKKRHKPVDETGSPLKVSLKK